MKKVVFSAAALMCGTLMFAQSNVSDVNQDGNLEVTAEKFNGKN